VTTLEAAQTAAATIGYPVVVKPSNQKGGRGIMTGLKSADEIRIAFERAREYSDRVLVESLIEGTDHRLMIVDGKFLAASMRSPPIITGDGKRTIDELIRELNTDPLRDGWRWKPVTEDSELNRLLDKAGYRLDTVLETGETIALRSTANISTGGTSIDLTDSVHPDNRELAVRAAKAIGLDVAGVDFMTTDVSQSYKVVGGAIIEVNARAGFRPHTWVVKGQPRDVAGAVIDNMFTLGNKGRVCLALIAGRQGRRPVALVLDHMLRSAGMSVGMVNDTGAVIDGEQIGPAESSVWKATETALRDPCLEAFVATVPPKLVVKRGLIHDECKTAAILDTADDGDIAETRQGLDVVVRATQGKLIVGAKNTLALAAVRDIDIGRVVLVSRNAGNAAVRRHLEAGGPAVVTARDRGEQVIALLDGKATVASIPINGVQTLSGRQFGDRINEHLFAVALAHGMGLSGEEITSALMDGTALRKPSPRQPARKSGGDDVRL
jgi:cyanophycin synthetase